MSSIRPAVDPRAKARAAGVQLQEALVSVSDALKTIANIVPSLFPVDDTLSKSVSAKPLSPYINQGDHFASPPTSNKRKRKERDPDAPEKPPSAYHLFAKEWKDQVKQSMGGQPSPSDVLHEVNRLWKELGDELKEVLDAMYELTRPAVLQCR
jgi:transcriptional regulator HMO1